MAQDKGIQLTESQHNEFAALLVEHMEAFWPLAAQGR